MELAMPLGVDEHLLTRAREIAVREGETFAARTPRSREWLTQSQTRMPAGVPMAWMRGLYRHDPVVAVRGSGSKFYDLDDNSYIDFNACDLAMPAGFAPPAIVEAMQKQAKKGNIFLLPTEESIEVCRLLTERFGLPQWQFTLSATGANTDALRIARVATGKSEIVVFEGKYHGHIDQTLWTRAEDPDELSPELLGLDPSAVEHTNVIPYNDVSALRRRLSRGDVAAVFVEPALTNCGLVLPEPEFVTALNTEVDAAGAVLIVDETHVQFAVHGGGTTAFGYEPDMITGGKGIAGGVPIGVVGMSDRIAAIVQENLYRHPGREFVGDTPGVAIGGTLFGNALSMTCALAGLSTIFTHKNFERVDGLGQRLQVGVQAEIQRVGLPWTADRLGGRIQWRLTEKAPRNGRESYASIILPISDARKLYLANRGVWDAIASAGPSVSYAITQEDVDAYIAGAGQFLEELTK